LPQLEQDYIKTGKVKYVTLDFPLESIHKNAFKAAEAARCAGAQGKYWEMHARLFANQGALDLKDLPGHAEALGLAMPAFQQSLESGRYAEAIRKDLTAGQQAGVTGTPAFFVGVTEANASTVKALRQRTGAQPAAAFQAAIDGLLAGHRAAEGKSVSGTHGMKLRSNTPLINAWCAFRCNQLGASGIGSACNGVG
jgi:protein-disulfide isomerase